MPVESVFFVGFFINIIMDKQFINQLLDIGFNIMPINNDKTPKQNWKTFQDTKIKSLDEFKVISEYYALICGFNDVEVIDIDLKILPDLPAKKAFFDELLELCDADIQVLNSVWQQFGLMTAWQLREYTHDHCPEWQDPDGSMIPMKPEDLFNALNFSPEQSAAYLGRMKQQAAINAAHINLNH